MRPPPSVVLCFAAVAYASAASAQVRRSPEARVLSVHGAVEVTPPEAVLHHAPAAVGDVLPRRSDCARGDASVARVALPNGAELTLLPGALVTWFTSGDAPPPGRPPSTITTLDAGRSSA